MYVIVYNINNAYVYMLFGNKNQFISYNILSAMCTMCSELLNDNDGPLGEYISEKKNSATKFNTIWRTHTVELTHVDGVTLPFADSNHSECVCLGACMCSLLLCLPVCIPSYAANSTPAYQMYVRFHPLQLYFVDGCD